MPKGPRRPSANTEFSVGASAPAGARKTRIWPDFVSAIKISPLSAVRSRRGPLRLAANGLTSNPLGTESLAVAGRSDTLGLLPTDLDAYVAGNCAIVMRWV